MEHWSSSNEDPSSVLARTEPDKIARVARALFFGIARDWQLHPSEQAQILGFASLAAFNQEFAEGGMTVSEALLFRISHLLNIHRCVLALAPIGRPPGAWIRNPCGTLADRSVLEVMLGDGDEGIEYIHQYLGALVHT